MLKTIFRISLLVALIVSVEVFFGWSELFVLVEQTAKNNENSLAIFFLLMSVGCAFAFPLSFCYLFAGVAFGFLKGWGICFAVLAVSSTIGYFLGRFFVPKNVVEKLCLRFGIDSNPRGRAMFNANFLVRVIPGIPYWIQNVILGGLRSDFLLYIVVNLFAQGAIAGAMNYFASSLAEEGLAKYLAFAILVLVLSIFHIAVNIVYKKSTKQTKDKVCC